MLKYGKKSALFIILITLVIQSCSGKYSDAKEVMEDTTEAMDGFYTSMVSAQDPKDVASAITNFAEFLEKNIARLEDVDRRYPELGNVISLEDKELPESLKESGKKLKKASKNISSPEILKIFKKYAADKEVLEAQVYLNKTLQKVAKSEQQRKEKTKAP